MASVQEEDARDLELQEELEQALHRFLRATDDRIAARAVYFAKLRAFAARVLKG
jgi:hypothetical protein